MSSSCSRFPFTATQWQELEHQALVFKYIVSGIPVPSELVFTIRTSLDTSLSSKFLIHQPQHLGWNSFQMGGFGRKIDPEPGRCRRTDGKKWRCSKEAYPDSKYCERHMHRGRNRSRKPVETLSPSNSTNTPPPHESHFLYRPPTLETPPSSFFLQPPNNRNNNNSSSSSYGHVMKGDYDLHKINEEQPKKVMHHFLDEWQPPKDKDSWTNSAEDKMPTHRTQLSISIPNSMHDFFVTQKW